MLNKLVKDPAVYSILVPFRVSWSIFLAIFKLKPIYDYTYSGIFC